MPNRAATELASPAPATPKGWPVRKPVISIGARMALTITVADSISGGHRHHARGAEGGAQRRIDEHA